jgi:hypothetical protein
VRDQVIQTISWGYDDHTLPFVGVTATLTLKFRDIWVTGGMECTGVIADPVRTGRYKLRFCSILCLRTVICLLRLCSDLQLNSVRN